MWIVDAVYERSQHKAFARGKLTEDMEQMSVGAGRLDRLLPDLLGGLSRHFALHVHHHGGRTRRHEPPVGAGVLLLPLDPDHGGRDLLRPVQIAAAASRRAQRHRLHAQRRALLDVLAIGFVVSFIVAYGVVAWFMNWVRTRGFTVFAIYRISLGVACCGGFGASGCVLV